MTIGCLKMFSCITSSGFIWCLKYPCKCSNSVLEVKVLDFSTVIDAVEGFGKV